MDKTVKEEDRWTWRECCEHSIEYQNNIGVEICTEYQTLERWNREFRTYGKFFNPNIDTRAGRSPLPPLLRDHPKAKGMIEQFTDVNLMGLTVNAVHDYIDRVVIPKVYEDWKKDKAARIAQARVAEEEEEDLGLLKKETFLKSYGITNFSETTVHNWMRRLGMKYDAVKKNFYVDGHEREDVQKYRKEFCCRYLNVYEPRCLRWLQLTMDQLKKITSKEKGDMFERLIAIAHSYEKDGVKMYELHEDHIITLESLEENEDLLEDLPAPDMSVRSTNRRKLMIIGQDESIFYQYSVTSKMWVKGNGKQPLLPKSEGTGKMISGFQSRDFGYGLKMTQEQFDSVNLAREGKHYLDVEAANQVLKSTEKSKNKLTESPFERSIVIGQNFDGYWNSHCMAIQFEDVVDCLKVLYEDYDFVFLFDHSQGHSRKREGALDVANMRVNFGGKTQKDLRDASIPCREGYMGSLPGTLQPGPDCVQCFNFPVYDEDYELQPGDGPFYLSKEEKMEKRYDKVEETGQFTDKLVAELKQEIEERTGTELGTKKRWKLPELQDMARRQNPPIDVKKPKMKTTAGWMGKPKGMLQIAYERGFLDLTNYKEFKEKGIKKDGKVDDTKSLRAILSKCTDFKTEKSMLQVHAESMGVLVDMTPKFHAEMAGEGIEYTWGFAKSDYRRSPFARKRDHASFLTLVDDCCGKSEKLNRNRVKRFAARARRYIITYHCLETNGEKDGILSLGHIEGMKKEFKCHRNAYDFARGFLLNEINKKQ
jgi:hypothetical protein